MTAKKVIKSDEDGCSKEEEEENGEDKENSKEDLAADVEDENTSNSGSRRSGRIARSANVLQVCKLHSNRVLTFYVCF